VTAVRWESPKSQKPIFCLFYSLYAIPLQIEKREQQFHLWKRKYLIYLINL